MKIKNILSVIILVLTLSLTVGFSAFVSEMSISNLVAEVRVEKDVRITDVKLLSEQCNSTSVSDLDYDADSILMSALFADNTSYAVVEVTVTNIGNVDVGLADLSLSETYYEYEILSGELEQAISSLGGTSTYIIKVSTTQPLTTNMDVKVDFDFRQVYSVTYEGTSDSSYPTGVISGGILSITFVESLERVQVLSNNVEIAYYESISAGQTINLDNITSDVIVNVKGPLVKLVSGSINEVGSEVCMDDECFYIISNDGTTVSMLAKYNLHVGNSLSETYKATALSNPTGIQNKTALGYTESGFPYIGITVFSSNSQKGDNYSDYEGSIVESYVNAYQTYLGNLGANISLSRLITKDELQTLGCVSDNYSCKSAPDWVYSSSYWSQTAYDTEGIWFVYSDGGMDSGNYSRNDYFGVRPVIEMSVDDVLNLVEFTVDSETYKAKKGITWGEWIESEYNSYGFKTINGYIYNVYGQAVLLNSVGVLATDVIDSMVLYTLSGEHTGGS